MVLLPLPVASSFFHFFNGHAEDEDILVAHFLGHLDVGTVEGADGHRTIEHELHVRCATGFHAGQRDLLGQISRGNNLLGHGHTVLQMRECRVEGARGNVYIFEEDHFQSIANGWVVVDHFADAVDQFNDLLGHVVAGCGLRRQENDARGQVQRSREPFRRSSLFVERICHRDEL